MLLGLAATLSHTAVVWIIALAGLRYGAAFNTEATEPYLQIVSAVLIIAIALWMVWRTWREAHPVAPGAHHHHHDHDHDHDHVAAGTHNSHAREHADQIAKRFAGGSATTGQIVMFGLTGGLIPCPASITILLLCLQLKQFSLGFTLVLCFSLGLAVTMVGVGAAAALSVRHVSTRWSGFDTFARRAPYFSSALIICVGLYTGWLGWAQLAGRGV